MTKFLIAGCCLLASVWAQADPTDDLIAALDRISNLQGSFEQVQYDESGTLVAESAGTFKLSRPGYFEWDITSPGSQLIVATPEFIWQHDRDLETVTRRPVVDSEQMSPLQVLGGNDALLRSQFSVSRTAESTYALHPQGINPGFIRLLVTFAEDGGFAGLEINDNLNQRVVIVFSDLNRSSPLGPEDFDFTPPADADQFFYD